MVLAGLLILTSLNEAKGDTPPPAPRLVLQITVAVCDIPGGVRVEFIVA